MDTYAVGIYKGIYTEGVAHKIKIWKNRITLFNINLSVPYFILFYLYLFFM